MELNFSYNEMKEEEDGLKKVIECVVGNLRLLNLFDAR